MAFLGRVCNIIRQATRMKMGLELHSSPSIFQAIRCMSNAPSAKLFVGGVSYSADEQSLREAFAKYGQVVDARIIMDRETGRSRGFAFVTYTTVEEASSAIQALDGQDLHGRQVKVNFAAERSRGFGGSYENSPYGAMDGSRYQGSYGNSPHGATGAYVDDVADRYGSRSSRYDSHGNGSGANFGGSYNHAANDSFGTRSDGGYYSGSGSSKGGSGDFGGSSHGGDDFGGSACGGGA